MKTSLAALAVVLLMSFGVGLAAADDDHGRKRAAPNQRCSRGPSSPLTRTSPARPQELPSRR